MAAPPDVNVANRANEETAPSEALVMPPFPDAGPRLGHGPSALSEEVGCVAPVHASHQWERGFRPLFTACNPEQGPSMINRLSLKLLALSSPSWIELGALPSSPMMLPGVI